MHIADAHLRFHQADSAHVLEKEYALVTQRSIEMESVVNGALAGLTPLTTVFPANNGLASQMRIVARLIGARAGLGLRRQVFFVSMGGFDNHNLLMQDHPNLMQRLNDAMSAFYAATVELGVSDKVTTFTASDFGRTLSSNADGSDQRRLTPSDRECFYPTWSPRPPG